MAHFIPLKTFQSLYSTPSDLLSEEGLRLFYGLLETKGFELALTSGYSEEDFRVNMRSFLDPSSIIFHGWVTQNDGLMELITSGKTSVKFIDTKKLLTHQLAEKFKRFISPFLAEKLLRFGGQTNTPSTIAFSYTQLLDEDHRAVVEHELFKPIQQLLNDLKAVKKEAVNEQALVNAVKPACSDEIIGCVNYLSRASYAKKLAFVDGLLDMLRAKSCTTRFANWILKQLEQVELNREHNHKIGDLKKELREGELQVKNSASSRTPIRWRSLVSSAIVLALIGLTAYIIYYKPFNKVEEEVFVNDTSFKDFTKEERIRIDSLLKEISHDRRPKEIEIDPSMPTYGGGTNLVLRKAFVNETMERIYDDLIKDADLKDTYPKDSCDSKKNVNVFVQNGGVKDLSTKSGSVEAMLKNESSYGIVVLVSEDKKNGNVYSLYLAPQETTTFKMDKFNSLSIIAGNDYQSFTAPKQAVAEELPSDQFKYHFCATDDNYKESINTAYQLRKIRSGQIKFLFTEDKSGYVYLLDIHNVLANY